MRDGPWEGEIHASSGTVARDQGPVGPGDKTAGEGVVVTSPVQEGTGYKQGEGGREGEVSWMVFGIGLGHPSPLRRVRTGVGGLDSNVRNPTVRHAEVAATGGPPAGTVGGSWVGQRSERKAQAARRARRAPA